MKTIKVKGIRADNFSNEDLCDISKSYFNGVFILCCCPFRVAKHYTSNSRLLYQTKRHSLQLILWAFITITSFAFNFCDIRRSLSYLSEKRQSPGLCFVIAAQSLELILNVIVAKQLLLTPHKFVAVLNLIVGSYSGQYNLPLVRKGTVSKIKVIVFTTFMLRLLLGNIVTKHILEFGVDFRFDYWSQYAEFGRECLLFGTGKNTTGDTITLTGHLLTGITLIMVIVKPIYMAFAEIVLMTMSTSLWALAFEFAAKLKTSQLDDDNDKKLRSAPTSLNLRSQMAWEVIASEYKEIKNLSELINDSFGNLVSLYFSYIVVYNAVLFESVTNWALFISQLAYLFGTVTFFVFTADACFQMSRLKDWLSTFPNATSLSGPELQMLLNQLDNNDIAIKASRVFPVTYSLLANMIGLTITYLIICMQSA